MATTTNLALNQPAYNSSAWDVPLNANEDILDAAFGNTTSVALTNSNVTLTSAQCRAMQIRFTGTISANIIITVPAIGGRWTFTNATSGSFTVTIASAGAGTSVAIAQGFSTLLFSDGTNIAYADNGLVTGSPTFTNLTITGTLTAANATARLNPRVSSQASPSSITVDIGNYDQYVVTALANALSFPASTTGTPLNGNKMIFRIKDDGTARALSWTTSGAGSYRAIGVTLPTTTVISKVLYVGCIYNSTESYWDVVAVNLQA
jgi:hypothetical protein